SDLTVQTVRVGLDYRLGRGGIDPQIFTKGPDALDLGSFAVHGQTTVVEAYAPPFTSPYIGQKSLTPNQGRETWDATLGLGVKLWRGGGVWFGPRIYPGIGFFVHHGVTRC